MPVNNGALTMILGLIHRITRGRTFRPPASVLLVVIVYLLVRKVILPWRGAGAGTGSPSSYAVAR
jgi:hypothetical protein